MRTNRRWESGILTAGCHSQPEIEESLDTSSPPSQRTTCPRCARDNFAHRRILEKSPKARAVTISTKSVELRISSNRKGNTSTFFISSALTTSDKKAHFFLFDSTSVTRRVG